MPKQLLPEHAKLLFASGDALYSLASVPNSKRILARDAPALVPLVESRIIRIVRTVPPTVRVSQLERCAEISAIDVLSPLPTQQNPGEYLSVQRDREHALRQAARAHHAEYILFRDGAEQAGLYLKRA